ncbi:LOW QUALITY PROTEIN: apoptosis facilitator Bcl-2-like protein 14 [Sorex fumeus]|uniref:LOW QUALITY PROTEIN: apoptosis facilitator Bcl-2-like protein 14 n=1 Tax=Sorex fumeus TaxID=62283 RepID=UPI0024AD8F5B|nr:LOW QUALITY PROTEIN: apoptosis facilitator Bcl-2-like protein 14 [Sorex fumeus]
MCTAGLSDLEEIPLDDDDSGSIEFQILAYYVKHHVFKNHATLFSPKRSRTRSLSQKGLGGWTASDPWPPLPWASRQSSPGEQTINLTKKKSSWRTLFGVTEKEESPTLREGNESPQVEKCAAGPPGRQWTRSLSSVDQRVELKAVDPKVVSVANRVAEIVYSWPPPKSSSSSDLPRGAKGNFLQQVFYAQGPTTSTRSTSAKKDGEDQAIAKIVELLKYSGDQLERELRKDKTLMSSFQDGLTYTLFRTITDQFLKGVDTRGESEAKAQSFRAALAIDVMTKLTALDTHPMSRVLGFGAKYLKEHFSPWVQQHGGWEKVFGVTQEEVD